MVDKAGGGQTAAEVKGKSLLAAIEAVPARFLQHGGSRRQGGACRLLAGAQGCLERRGKIVMAGLGFRELAVKKEREGWRDRVLRRQLGLLVGIRGRRRSSWRN
jgi:hypothetical protein